MTKEEKNKKTNKYLKWKYHNNPEWRKRIIEKNTLYCKKNIVKNREKRRIYTIKYRNKNRIRFRKYQQEYRLKNRDRIRKYERRITLLRRYGITVELLQKIYEENIKLFGTLTCFYCKEKIEFGKDHIEHKIPISRGGLSIYENLTVSCPLCNFTKGRKTEQEFLEWRKQNEKHYFPAT